MRRTIFIWLIQICFFPAASQDDTFTVSGHVVDEKGQPVPFANAALFSSDSSLVTGAVSNDNGFFEINANPGQYYLRLSFLSYQEKIVSPLQVNNGNVALGKITMVSGAVQLEELVVQGERSQMELSLDKRVFNVGKDLSNISGSASDILDNVPSVAVDVDGNVSLRGSGNVRILIDGKPSGLTGISTADALRQLQANLIERVEVITNPSARYDAEGEVGIINIVLKKEKKSGVNGSFALNTGYPANHGASYNINFRREKFNFFSSYGLSYQARPGKGHSYQYFEQEDTTFSYRQQTQRNRAGLSHNVRAGIDYFINNKSTITGALLVRKSDGRNTSNLIYEDYDAADVLVRTVARNEKEEEPELNTEASISYRREFDKPNKLLTIDFKWIENDEIENSDFTETDDSNSSTKVQRSRNTENERNVLGQIDFVQPMGEKGKWEAGMKATSRVLDNDFLVEEQDNNEDWFPLDNYNNNLVYRENIYAAYWMAGNELGDFSFQGGLRGELSDISVELKRANQISYQNYFNLFPSAHLSYKITEQKTIQLSYSYRLSRPDFRDLIPFSGFSDNRAVMGGNPNLKPEYTNSLETGYLLNWKSGSLLSSMYYRYRTGVIQEIPLDDPNTGFTRPFPINLSTEDAYGFEFNFSWNPIKWMRLNSSANFYRAITEGHYNDIVFFSDTYTWNTRTTSRITVLKQFDFQAGINYRAPRQTPTGSSKAMYAIDLGLSRDVFSGNGTLTLGVRDLLNTRKFRGTTEREGYYSESVFQGRPRQVTLTFTYRLNQKKERQRNRDDDDEGRDDNDRGEFK